MVLVRLELVLRGGHSSGFVDSFMPPFMGTVVGLFAGMFCGSGRSSFEWFGLMSRSVRCVLPTGKIQAHAGWSLAFDVDDVEMFLGSLDFAQWRISSRDVFVANSGCSSHVGHSASLFLTRSGAVMSPVIRGHVTALRASSPSLPYSLPLFPIALFETH